MSISLVKGGNLSLTKAAPNLASIDELETQRRHLRAGAKRLHQGGSIPQTRPNWPVATSPRMRRQRPPWSSVRCTGTVPKWKFRAIGQGYSSGLAGIAKDYGANL